MYFMKNHNFTPGRVVAASLILTFLPFFTPALYGCSVPVFRYALQRWQADSYLIEIVYHKSLSAQAQEAVELLENYTKATGQSANLIIRHTTKAEYTEKDKDLSQQPQMVVYFPAAARNPTPIWKVHLTVESVNKLVDSPVRRELVRRLISGDSVVWMLLESGDKQKDDNAAKMIQEQLKSLQQTLKLPTNQMVWEDGTRFAPNESSELKVKFSMIRLKRDDPREKFLIDSLLRTERDLLQFEEPMVFPVFGKGIVLYALIGKGINPKNITYSCQFLSGPCSCQVKQQNPGTDLLLKTDWTEVPQFQSAFEEPFSPYVVVVDSNEPNEIHPGTEPNTTTAQNSSTPPPATSLAKSILLVFALGLTIIIIGSVAIRRNQNANLQSQEKSEE